MNSTRIYNEIIANRKNNPILLGYTEKHHIIPRSLGGGNTPENLIKLTAREHFICHLLLTHMYVNDRNAHAKMVKAFRMMVMVKGTGQNRYTPSREYNRLKHEYSRIQSDSQTGSKNNQFGTMWITNEVKSMRIKKEQEIPSGWRKGKRQPYTKELKKKHCKICDEVIRHGKFNGTLCDSKTCWLASQKGPNKPFRCIETNEFFDKLKQAAEKFGCSTSTINDILRGIRKYHKGFSFEYVGQ